MVSAAVRLIIPVTFFGDGDFDNDADLIDYELMQACYGGPSVPLATGCEPFDFDADEDVDLDDIAAFQRAFGR